ncbi:bifunctional phosphopantothenoylcysteine decarboxylase/phosphopantothenate--cysteine ligase CoaBC [Prochlorococcus marinus]|uniref:bifunctional phosphopantothenoylcysteine decarboxylase/phosphopantothenate--cysteine ligase CoaBC n=1 Tax=Prochlorococcus marinus TaxID=1219 RepID=UPI0022B3F6EC|nr:bifunctional phosphopantothenoylcysteine decarboxylase/phosphopantothenate--cysteine ligase CoaBC [Prochlorococcus marinus]
MKQLLKGKKLLIIATGSIAAIKTPLLISNLIKQGAEVRCVVTESAAKLVSPLSLSIISRNRCYQDEHQWDHAESRPLHIALAEWADIVVVAPLSASSLAKWVHGLAENLSTSILLASEKPIIIAPAMNTGMWNNPLIKANWNKVKDFPNLIPLPPSEGLLACDRIGNGRMVSVELIQLAIESATIQIKEAGYLKKDLKDITLLISAGATIEDIDSARFFTNRSSGKMGVFLSQAARFRGAKVDLIHGPLQMSSTFLEGLNCIEVRSAKDMLKSLESLQPSAEVIAMSAAVADIKSTNISKDKIEKKELLQSLANRFEIVPDLLHTLIKNKKKNQIFLGFAALAGSDNEIKRLAISKKNQKCCDLLMANPIDRENQGFESDSNGGWLLDSKGGVKAMPVNCKLSIAHQLLDSIKGLLMSKSINN